METESVGPVGLAGGQVYDREREVASRDVVGGGGGAIVGGGVVGDSAGAVVDSVAVRAIKLMPQCARRVPGVDAQESAQPG